MPKNVKKYKKSTNTNNSRELILKDENTCYAIIKRCTGGAPARFEVDIINGDDNVSAVLRGALKNIRIKPDMYVLLLKDENTTDRNKYFINHVYSPNDVKQLKRIGELTIIDEETKDELNDGIMFEGDYWDIKKEQEQDNDLDFIDDI
jgi:hypothetical protein